jgi:hypothetical protein
MIRAILCSLALLVGFGLSRGQAAAPPPRTPRLELSDVLEKWAEAADKRGPVRYRFTQTNEDMAFKTKEVFQGIVRMRKPDLLRVDWGEGEKKEILLFARKSNHWFRFKDKSESIFPKPADCTFLGEKTPRRSFWENLGAVWSGEWLQQEIWWLFAGLPVRDLSRRFEVELGKVDRWYVYLDIRPRQDQDRSNFKRMRVVLEKKGFQVRQLWMQRINDNTTTWDFKAPIAEPGITGKSIRKGLPSGWRQVPVPDRLEGEAEK